MTKHRCEIMWHEELRQCDTLWVHVPRTRNNCSCECVCVTTFCPCCELRIKVPATFPVVCMGRDLTAASCPRDMSWLHFQMYVRNLMLSLPRASDTGACYSPPHVNETVIYCCYKSLGRVPAAVLNCLCWLSISPVHLHVKCPVVCE